MRGLRGRAVVIAALAGLLFGFDTAVIAATTADLRRVFDLGPAVRSWRAGQPPGAAKLSCHASVAKPS